MRSLDSAWDSIELLRWEAELPFGATNGRKPGSPAWVNGREQTLARAIKTILWHSHARP